MDRKMFLCIAALISLFSYGQESGIEKISIEFEGFKRPHVLYTINQANGKLNCKVFSYNPRKDILFDKSYAFIESDYTRLETELYKEMPDSIVNKSELVMDGGRFTITYFKRTGGTSKLIITNPSFRNGKYDSELKKINAFFDFAYLVIKDYEGMNYLDESYDPYHIGLPIRKISDSPLEYKIWGSVSGDASMDFDNGLLDFLQGLPKDRCVIIDCNDNLSYAWLQDILKLYIINESNIKFVNVDYLKYTREYLIEVRDAVELAEKENREFIKNERNSIHKLYFSDPDKINKWLELPEKLLFISVEKVRRNCK